jgi:hypothetical protein
MHRHNHNRERCLQLEPDTQAAAGQLHPRISTDGAVEPLARFGRGAVTRGIRAAVAPAGLRSQKIPTVGDAERGAVLVDARRGLVPERSGRSVVGTQAGASCDMRRRVEREVSSASLEVNVETLTDTLPRRTPAPARVLP